MAEHIGNKPDVLSPRITIHTKIFQGGLFEYMRFEGKNLELSEKSPLIKNGKLNINEFWTIIHKIAIDCCENYEEREALTKYPVEIFGSSLYLADEGWVDLDLIGDIDINIPSIKFLSSSGAIIDAKNRIHEALKNYSDERIKLIRFSQELSAYVSIYTIGFNVDGKTINYELAMNFGRRVKFYWDWYLSSEVRKEVFDNDTVYQAQRYVEIMSWSQLPSSWLIGPELLRKFLKRVVFFTRLTGHSLWKKYRDFLRKKELDEEDFRSIAHTMRSIKEQIDNGTLNIFKMSHILNILNPPQQAINPNDLSPQGTFHASFSQRTYFNRQIIEKGKQLDRFSKTLGKSQFRGHEFVVNCLTSAVGENYTPQEYVCAFEMLEMGGYLKQIKSWDAKRLRFLFENLTRMTNRQLGEKLGVNERAVSTQLNKLFWRRADFINFEETLSLINRMKQKGKLNKEIVDELNLSGLGNRWGRRNKEWILKSIDGFIRRSSVNHVRSPYRVTTQELSKNEALAESKDRAIVFDGTILLRGGKCKMFGDKRNEVMKKSHMLFIEQAI